METLVEGTTPAERAVAANANWAWTAGCSNCNAILEVRAWDVTLGTAGNGRPVSEKTASFTCPVCSVTQTCSAQLIPADVRYAIENGLAVEITATVKGWSSVGALSDTTLTKAFDMVLEDGVYPFFTMVATDTGASRENGRLVVSGQTITTVEFWSGATVTQGGTDYNVTYSFSGMAGYVQSDKATPSSPYTFLILIG